MCSRKVTILLVSYNQEQYIEQCLDGILMQEFSGEMELLICDDCSSDGTLARIKKALSGLAMHYRVLHREQNLGRIKNLKQGFSECTGDYVAILEGDDYWTDPLRIKKHVDFLEFHRECSLSFNLFVKKHENGRHFTSPARDNGESYRYITTAEMAKSNQIGNMSAIVIRRSSVTKLTEKFWDLNPADWGFGMALGEFGLIARLNDVMSVYRVHNNGLWSGLKQDEIKARMIKSIRRWNDYFDGAFSAEFDLHARKYKALSVLCRLRNRLKQCLPRSLKKLVRRFLLS